MTLSPDRRDDSTPRPRPIHRYSRRLSLAIDHAVIQVEAADAMGDAETAKAWRRVLRCLEQTIPEPRR